MKQKTISELTIEELREVVKEAKKVNERCTGHSCDGCVIDSDTYTDAPSVPCDEVYEYLKGALAKREAEQIKEPVPQDFEYTDDYEFTPENTSIEYLIENNLLEKLDDYIGRLNKNGGMERRNEICSRSACITCRLRADNFSDTLVCGGDNGCAAIGNNISIIRTVYKALSGVIKQPPKRIQKTCKDCKFRTEVGEFIYCNAWKNFTTNDMTCGYYLTKETEGDILEE